MFGTVLTLKAALPALVAGFWSDIISAVYCVVCDEQEMAWIRIKQRETGVVSSALVDDINFRTSSVGVGKACQGCFWLELLLVMLRRELPSAPSLFHLCSLTTTQSASAISLVSLHLSTFWTAEYFIARPPSVLRPYHEPSLHSRIRHHHLKHRRHAQRHGSELGEISEEVCR